MKDGYISKYNERNYAPKIRKLEKRTKIQHKNRDESGKETEPSCCNSSIKSREIKEEIVVLEEKTYWNPFKEKKKRKSKDDPS
jgi:hypothetical protein